MSTAPTTPLASKASLSEKFTVEKATHEGVTLLTMHGTLNESFEGKKAADLIRSKKVVVNMRDVSRFASWGMSEWMDFLRVNAARDLYLVECSTYAVSQLNLVTGLLGHGKLVSFHASYRCGSCGKELESLIIIPSIGEGILDLAASHTECASCGGEARLEDYPASFFETIAGRPQFDIDDEVLGFLRSHYKYDLHPDLTRFRAFRLRQNDFTYLRLSGSLAQLPGEVLAAGSEGTTVVDLEGIVFDPEDAEQWRSYVQPALAKLPSLQLLNCPPGFVETAVHVSDLHDKVKVRTFALAYSCLRCETSSIQWVDVAEHLELLVAGTAPPARCVTCKSLLVAVLTPEQLARFRVLPARSRDLALDRFLGKARGLPADKLENCLALPQDQPTKPRTAGRGIYAVVALATLVVAAGGAFAAWQLSRRDNGGPVIATGTTPIVTPPPRPAFTRPEWIMSDGPLTAYCHDLINRLMCVGVSAYAPTRDQAVGQANNAALEELVATIGLKISDPFFRDNVLPGVSAARTTTVSAMQAADLDRASPAYVAANVAIAKAQQRVVEIFQLSGGAAVPAQRSDWYWEEYVAANGKGNETLVFVRYDVTLDAVRALVERYSTITPVLRASSAMTAFPGLAWQYDDFTGGALLTKVGSPLSHAGLAAKQIVMAVGPQRITDAGGLVRVLGEQHDTVELTVKPTDAPAHPVNVKLH